MKKKKDTLLTIVAILATLFAVIFFSYIRYEEGKLKENDAVAGVEKKVQSEYNYTVTVADYNSVSKTYIVSFHENETLFDALKELDRSHNDFEFAYEESSFGAYITSVNGYEPDSTKQFWKIQINGADAQVGISDYKLKENDIIAILIDTIQF